MKKKTFAFFLILILIQIMPAQEKDNSGNIALVIHGGAGTMLKKNMTPGLEKEYNEKLKEALQKGYEVLRKGGSSMDAVVAAVMVMEDSPLFNAGKGAVFTHDGKNEMDASVMDGKTLSAGSVAGVRRIKNPITAARAVMEKSNHVMMIGAGAEKFAKECGLTLADTSYFFTQKRWDQLQKAIKEEKVKLDHSDTTGSIDSPGNGDYKFGTVGAVALDQYGNLAAGTSTGGMTNKRYGRVGDAPIIGAGTYCSNKTCGVSATGHGEYFIRAAVAHDISARMEHKGISLEQAADEVVMKKLVEMGGEGGVVALDKNGNIAMPFNTAGMYRGYVKKDGILKVFIYKE